MQLSSLPPHTFAIPTANKRPGGRAARVLERVLAAACSELSSHGYVGFTYPRVAKLAGVNKTTLYRRWPEKIDLVRAVVNQLGSESEQVPPPDLELAEQLRVLAEVYRDRLMGSFGALLVRLIAEVDQPELSELVHEVRSKVRKPWLHVVRKAMRAGILREDLDPDIFVELILNSIRYRAVVKRSVSQAFLARMIDLVLHGSLHRSAQR